MRLGLGESVEFNGNGFWNMFRKRLKCRTRRSILCYHLGIITDWLSESSRDVTCGRLGPSIGPHSWGSLRVILRRRRDEA